MVLSENVYFLILFTLPAALNVIYNAYIRHTPIAREDKSVELAECIIFCLAVFLVNVLYMKEDILAFAEYSMNELSDEQRDFNYISFMIKYFVTNMISSILVIVAWYTIGQKLWRYIRNKLNVFRKRPEELKFSDVWSNVFETNNIIDISNCIIKIEHDGSLVSAGLIRAYSAPNRSNREFVLYNTDLIKQLFEDDANLKLDERMFQNAICEYYDADKNVLIKFYDTKKYDEEYAEEK
ncbi:MAG: hypothetical protein Q4F83_15295 [Eubacteriales bacterium]|nr:hypothetical protein [Eubacteriales bacterium]